MPRTNIVKKARKDQGNCRSCGTPIVAGDTYKWAHPRYRSRVVVCSKCNITPSMTSSSKMVAVWDSQEAVTNAIGREDIAQAVRDLAETAREVGQEYQESADSQREYFPESDVANENEEKGQSLKSWADELDNIAEEIDGLDASAEAENVDVEALEAEKVKLTEEFMTFDESDETGRREEIEQRLEEIEEELNSADEILETASDEDDKARELADGVADDCPV